MTTYFTKEIKPTVPASKQHAGAFGSGTILFDWTEFKIPSGGAKLIGASVLVRPIQFKALLKTHLETTTWV